MCIYNTKFVLCGAYELLFATIVAQFFLWKKQNPLTLNLVEMERLLVLQNFSNDIFM